MINYSYQTYVNQTNKSKQKIVMELPVKKQKGSIYLLMGYFGSGKTTFIKKLLSNKQGVKYAVIQNQFAEGEMGIQQPLIMDQTGVPFSSFLQLPNGCICCSAKNDLVAGIQYILNNTDVKNIVCETNGIADPAESIKQFWFDQNMNINAQLHSIISIFSAEKFPKIKNEQLFSKQAVFCNKALITFIDKVQKQRISQLEQHLRSVNPNCKIAYNNQFDIIELVAGDGIFEIASFQANQNKLACQLKVQPLKKMHHGIKSVFIEGVVKAQTKQQFEIAIGNLLWESGIKVMRIKGVVCLKDSQFVYELQGVEDTFELKDTKTSKNKFDGITKILTIGQNINTQQIKKAISIQQK